MEKTRMEICHHLVDPASHRSADFVGAKSNMKSDGSHGFAFIPRVKGCFLVERRVWFLWIF